MIPALVLTAGLATRLRPLSFVRAKAALPVAGEPLVRRILRQLAGAGVPQAILNLHHLPHTITRIVGDGADLGLRVRYSWEDPVLGSAGGPRRAIPLLATGSEPVSGPFLIVNGDTIADLDLEALARAHQKSGALVTMAVVPNDHPEKYGGILVGRKNVVTGFAKKGADQPSWHFIGVQVASPVAFSSVPPNVPWESVNALYPELMRQRPDAVRVVPCSARFHDIGTPADYLDTALLFASGGLGTLAPGARTRIEATARIERSIVWDDVVVEEEARLTECVVTDGVCVPTGSTWERVSLRRAGGPLSPGEHVAGDLAVWPF